MATNPATDNISFEDFVGDAMKTSPISLVDINQQAQTLAALFPSPRRKTIYDLATDLSRGLTAQAQSGQPASVGYGLATGFNLFTENVNKNKEKAEELKQKLQMMAYQDVQAKREQQSQLRGEFAKAQFEALLEGGRFDLGSSALSKALMYIAEAEHNPSLKATPEYAIAVALANRPQTQFQQTESGTVPITTPGLNIEEILEKKAKRYVDGVEYTPTGKMTDPKKDPSGISKPIYLNPQGQQVTLD